MASAVVAALKFAKSADTAPFIWMLLGALVSALVGYALAQPITPNTIPGCVYDATPPTLTNGQTTVLTCDINGKLRVNGS